MNGRAARGVPTLPAPEVPAADPGFGRAVAVVGIITGVLGIPSEALRPLLGVGYLPYGLLLPVWFGLVGANLVRR